MITAILWILGVLAYTFFIYCYTLWDCQFDKTVIEYKKVIKKNKENKEKQDKYRIVTNGTWFKVQRLINQDTYNDAKYVDVTFGDGAYQFDNERRAIAKMRTLQWEPIESEQHPLLEILDD